MRRWHLFDATKTTTATVCLFFILLQHPHHTCVSDAWILRDAVVSSTASSAGATLFTMRGGGGGKSSDQGTTIRNKRTHGMPTASSSSTTTMTTVEEYAAAMAAKDAQDRQQQQQKDASSDDAPGSSDAKNGSDAEDGKENPEATAETPDDAVVGVKAHSHNKKSNAVGDPDGEGSDDSDDESDDTDHWEEFVEEDIEFAMDNGGGGDVDPQVQVEVEMVEESADEPENDSDDNPRTVSGGGVGVRLGNRLRRKGRKEAKANGGSARIGQKQLLEVWQPFVFLPPKPAALDYLTKNSRLIDGASKSRLDRRTMYACLLLEWVNGSSSSRKFFDKTSAQMLQSALSIASQPQWRKVLPQPSGIRLYDNDSGRGCTLAMQETIAMALAHSMGAGLVFLDDEILSSIRQQLLRIGYTEDDVKPAILIHSLLALARDGKLSTGTSGLISTCMHKDLSSGLDDPFDERAAASCQEMAEWEQNWNAQEEDEKDDTSELPLILFVRAQGSNSLLKSKSAVEALLKECNSSEGTNLVVLGKGIDSKTSKLPDEPTQSPPSDAQDTQRRNGGPSPFFGFSAQNQNASGQNDPEGSRRFNIFLARTVDADGTPGILGAIAPPQAGNLFPHMMAMQARERMQNQDDDSATEELERIAQNYHEQMSPSSGGTPPQFFNATLSMQFDNNSGDPAFPGNMQPPPPEVIQQTLQIAMGELLDRLAQMNDDQAGPNETPSLHRAFAQVLRNESLRRGIAENLARAAPALSDPKCQGVMLSVYVPPPPTHANKGQMPSESSQNKQQQGMGNWFQKILNNQEEEDAKEQDEEKKRNNKQKRVRTMAAAAAVAVANKAQVGSEKNDNKATRNLSRLETVCRPIQIKSPADPVRTKSWDAWVQRERGSVIFRQNRQVLNEQLEQHALTLQEHTGTRGAGSALRQMLSVRDVTDEMEDVIKCVIQLEAAKSQRLGKPPKDVRDREVALDVDVTLSQLLLTDDGLVEKSKEVLSRNAPKKKTYQRVHPSSLETALTTICKISPSPTGGLSVSSSAASHRTRDEISALAQDKHERALVSQVVSPQDIGVTYDMIGGLSEVKELLRQSITYPLRFPHLYSEGIAREAVKGVLLFGPPGTGKTMLAKAVATEGGASFLSVDASSVENKWLGESEKNAKAVFTLARRLAPCVIFVDEVDSLLSSREGSSDDSAHGTLTSVKTTMMSEWDGLNSGTNGAGEAGSDRVIVIGSTNRPFDLDEAVLRRFPRRILVDLPDLETRREILEVTLAENRLDQAVNLTKVAERLEGYTGSDIKEVCREAVVQISHEQARLLDQGLSGSKEDVTQGTLQRLRPVTMKDFDNALDKLKRSVSEKGRELARVWEWNDEYGEIKKEKKNHLPHLANMYL